MECKKAFEKLKTALTSNLALYVASDASNFGLEVVILHKEDGKLKPIQHVSRMLLPADRKGRFSYHICDQEIS